MSVLVGWGTSRPVRLVRVFRVDPAEGFEFERLPWTVVSLTCGCWSYACEPVEVGALMYCARHRSNEDGR